MKGQILAFEENEGIILGEDEKRYKFTLQDWKEKTPPLKGAKVDFEANGENARDIYLLDIPSSNFINLNPNIKTLGGLGAVFLLLGWMPYIGIGLYLIGLILLSIAFKDLSNLAPEKGILKKWLISIALIFFVAIAFVIAIGSIAALSNDINQDAIISSGFGIWFLLLIVTQIVIGILYKQIFTSVYEITGENLFKTAGNTFFWGGILSIILIGNILFFIGWILVAIAFFSIKTKEV